MQTSAIFAPVVQDDDDDVGDGGDDDGGQPGKNVLMLTNLRRSATYTCVASSDLGNIAYDVDVIVKGIFTRQQRHVKSTETRSVHSPLTSIASILVCGSICVRS